MGEGAVRSAYLAQHAFNSMQPSTYPDLDLIRSNFLKHETRFEYMIPLWIRVKKINFWL